MTNDLNSIGERIKYIRRTKRMTQIDFAKSLEILHGTLSEIEFGKIKPKAQ